MSATSGESLRTQVARAVASACKSPDADETAIVDAVIEIFEPTTTLPPGVELRRTMQAMGLSQVAFAKAVGVSTKHLNLLCHGKAALSYETALRLEDVTGVPAPWWNAAEAAYRTALMRGVRETWRGPRVEG